MTTDLNIKLGFLRCKRVYLLGTINEDLGLFLEFLKG